MLNFREVLGLEQFKIAGAMMCLGEISLLEKRICWMSWLQFEAENSLH